ncbi:MAG TPA: hypothetical protein VLD84_05905 [Nitrososphaeraceae archaeon]|nr:hypothetical protein [Nitrososphaeraceae archaeon]
MVLAVGLILGFACVFLACIIKNEQVDFITRTIWPWTEKGYWTTPVFGGIVAGIGLFLANILLDRYRRPCIKIKKQTSLGVDIDLSIFEIKDPGLREEFWNARKFTVMYKVSRLRIENSGKTAAEECKGVLNDGLDKKICWNIPSERYKISINAKSFEYLDVCAILQSKKDAAQLTKELNDIIHKIGHSYGNVNNVSKVNEEYPKVNQWIKELKPEELFPKIIALTEKGWQSPPHLNWRLDSLNPEVTISSKNAKPRTIKIRIRDKIEENGRCFDVESPDD